MSDFTIWVAGAAVIGFFLSWIMYWIEFEPFATMVGIFSVITMGALVIMGLDEIIHFVATSMGF